jgi:mRNA-degrading endonuclease RelE of RelBE toxin-antitoxin system
VQLVETSKFKKSRKKIKGSLEKEALKEAVLKILHNPSVGKKLKGEFQDLRSFGYSVKGQNRRLIYKQEKDCFILLSFGPREGIYK